MTEECAGGAEVGVDWINHLVLHENDRDWHAAAEWFAEFNDERFADKH